jgi:hypothetical protein
MEEPRNQLILNISNSRPIPVANLGRLFEAMASDYRRATGRQLIVAQIERGSLVVILQEAISHFQSAADLADSVNHLVEFANIGVQYPPCHGRDSS